MPDHMLAPDIAKQHGLTATDLFVHVLRRHARSEPALQCRLKTG